MTADEILAQSGAYGDPSAATPADATWAELCAGAVSEGLDVRLIGAVWPGQLDEPPRVPAELRYAALGAGVEAYKRREATFGITGYIDLQGAAIRIARDYLEAMAPLIARYATVGIA